MGKPAQSQFKYAHGDKVTRPFSIAHLIPLVASIVFFAIHMILGGILALIIFFIIQSMRKKNDNILYITPRYLICGNRIVYYKNIEKLIFYRPAETLAAHTLVIVDRQRRDISIEKNQFPTGARKDHKIEANRAAKFKKVTDKILEKVHAQAPQARIETETAQA